ncbi:hypothetical protein BU14_0562s0004 [Porphyra umbilicalis]|uniref:Uncharacterized protein n=1 Tax=Porphyra umbilicalis TaxID=2786 RepID=A0A1X6NRT3_PORUM|nr:hypothetical protein BU14_0562s0004 [Porphyra umbilicalis]|eukprot:OSX71292.1 hypothetical protein BU14_0562s0004 [Porphyra umbilicalis]
MAKRPCLEAEDASCRSDGCAQPAELDTLRTGYAELSQRVAALEQRGALFATIDEKVTLACTWLASWSTSPAPLQWLHALAGFDTLMAGRSLQAVVRSRLLERVQSRPPSRTRRARNKNELRLEVDSSRGAFDQMVKLANAQVTVSATGSSRVTLAVSFDHPRALLVAIDLPLHLHQSVLVGTFRKKHHDVVSRVIVEQCVSSSGGKVYILERSVTAGQVAVAMRSTEDFDTNRMSFKHPLQRRELPASSLPAMSVPGATSILWRSSSVSMRCEENPMLMCGKLIVSLPTVTFEGDARDLAVFM